MSNSEKNYVKNVLNQYEVKDETKLNELKRLDKKAKLPANVFAYVFGSIGSLVLGFGMCVAMKIILADLMWLGIVVGLVGIVMVTINYFIYKKLLENGKNKYREQIQKLSNELLNN